MVPLEAGNLQLDSFRPGRHRGGQEGAALPVGNDHRDDLGDWLGLLERHEEYTPARIINEFRGSPYAYESLPFTFMFFCRNPGSVDSLFDVMSAGHDADINGSMIGALLGALHGTAIFPPRLVEGLLDREAVVGVADQFFEKFGGA